MLTQCLAYRLVIIVDISRIAAGGYDPGDLVIDKSITINALKWDIFMRVLDAAKFWQLPTTGGKKIGFDGTRTILEALKDGRYHVVSRWDDHLFDHAFWYALGGIVK